MYIVVQCLGGVCGAAILASSITTTIRGAETLGVTTLGYRVTPGQAVATEIVITMLLLLVIFGASADRNSKSSPLALGLTVSACHLYALPITGASMNPARSLGPALVTGIFHQHWVYWAGPGVGATMAGIFYQTVLRTRLERGVRDREKKEKRSSQCWKDNEVRDDESPPYVKREEPVPAASFSVLATQESDGKELVWLENLK